MYKVIIVDDEPVIRKGLRETIEWDSLGLEVAGEAANGVDALKLIKAIRPEILITDIRMPEMDGLQLIREIRKLDIDPKITIMSGYSDYSYLKAAIQLGVDNYLLKPIDNDELISNLKNAVREIESEAASARQTRQDSELLRINTLRRLVNGNIGMDELREKADFLNMPIRADRYLCVICTANRQTTVEERQIFAANLMRFLNGAVRSGSLLSFIDSDGHLALLAACPDLPNQRRETQRTLEEVVDRASRNYNFPLIIGVGRSVNRIEDIPKAYESARESLEYGVFLTESGVIWYDSIPESALPERALERIDFVRMKEFVRQGDRDGLKAHLDESLSALIRDTAPSINQMHNLMMHISVGLTENFRELYGNMNVVQESARFDYSHLFALRKYDEMRLWLMALIDSLFAAKAVSVTRNASLVNLAMSYISDHYQDGLTLKQVASVCHINTSYLGQLFRRETGQAFTDYVNEMRIREAQRLLADPTLKVYEVAERVGFTNYQYFLKIFKKMTGATPKGMRS